MIYATLADKLIVNGNLSLSLFTLPGRKSGFGHFINTVALARCLPANRIRSSRFNGFPVRRAKPLKRFFFRFVLDSPG